MFGRAVVEYKRPRLLRSAAEREAAALQGLGYLKDDSLGAQVVLITDGETWAFLRDAEAGPEQGEQAWFNFDIPNLALTATERFAWRKTSSATSSAVLEQLSTLRTAPVSSRSVIDRLGPARKDVSSLVDQLAIAIRGRANKDRADTLYRQWVQLAGVAYGLGPEKSVWKDDMAALFKLKRFTELTDGEGLFVLHTYVSIASKLLAAEVLSLISNKQDLRPTQWQNLSDADLSLRLTALEAGETTAELGAPAMLGGDLFGWYVGQLSASPNLVRAFRGVLKAMAELAWARVANAGNIAVDLLRELYQAVVPRSVRKALGEFFTPRYIAERMLEQAVTLLAASEEHGNTVIDPVKRRVLDPSCGSGTFLVAALRLGIQQLASQGKADDPTAISALLENVIGFDINPVSPIMTRVNLLLTLGDRAKLLPQISFRVFQTDSILHPEPITGQIQLGGQADALKVSLEVGTFELPKALATMPGLRALRDHIETSIKAGRSSEMFRKRLERDLRDLILDPGSRSRALDGAEAIYDRIRTLNAEDRNGVWARVIEQSMAPALLQPVDLVIGNPPWISWKDLPEAWKKRSESVWRQWGLWQTNQRGSAIPLSDISTLLTARSIASYCPSGVVTMLLPQSVLLADPSGRSLRRCHLRPKQGDSLAALGDQFDADVVYGPLFVDDFSEIKPFSPDAQNLPVAVHIRPGVEPTFPIEGARWKRAVPRARLDPSKGWSATLAQLTRQPVKLEPVECGDRESPWAEIWAAGDLKLGAVKEATYAWGRGYETRGLDGLFFCRVLSDAPFGPQGHVRIVNVPQAGKNTKTEKPKTAVVESRYLWPLVKGEHVSRWLVEKSDLYCIVPHGVDDLRLVLSKDEMADLSPLLFDYLEPWIPRLAGRSLYQANPDSDRPWALSGPFEHLDAAAHLVLVRYIQKGGMPGAAVVGPTHDPRIGRETVPFPNNKSNILFTKKPREAHYLAGWINSRPAQRALGRFAASTGITPKALSRLPIPRFDESNAGHSKLAEYSELAANAAKAGDIPTLSTLELRIDDLVLPLV